MDDNLEEIDIRVRSKKRRYCIGSQKRRESDAACLAKPKMATCLSKWYWNITFLHQEPLSGCANLFKFIIKWYSNVFPLIKECLILLVVWCHLNGRDFKCLYNSHYSSKWRRYTSSLRKEQYCMHYCLYEPIFL